MRNIVTILGMSCLLLAVPALADDDDDGAARALPTGQMITPLAARGARQQLLRPDPDFAVDHAMSLERSPDGGTVLILTSGFNTQAGHTSEYVFVFDVTGKAPRQTQVLSVPNSFAGLAFAPDGQHFYVGGGVDDALLGFSPKDGAWAPDGEPVKLGHREGYGMSGIKPETAGVALTADGRRAVVANIENDSVSVIDLGSRAVREIDLRRGGTYPFWVAVRGNDKAYVSSLRDRAVLVLDLAAMRVVKKIGVPGNPNRMLLDKAGGRLFVAQDNSDLVSVIDTASDRVAAEVKVTAPKGLLAEAEDYRGAAPDSLALSADETRLYVGNGGANAVAVVALDRTAPAVIGLIPVGWYPNDVLLAGSTLMVVNGKSPAGPNPGRCNTATPDAARKAQCQASNQYVEQLEKATLLTLPAPSDADLEELTRRVAANNSYSLRPLAEDVQVMRELRRHIRHVIYVVKENRTYDQVLGDLGTGNGDPALTEFGETLTPNQHAMARNFVDLDNFYDSGEVSGDGWAWSTAARETDIVAKEIPVNYAGRGMTYESEGTNRDVNVGLATLAERRDANPATPDDPDLLPGTADVAAPDPAKGPHQRGYLWDAALRAGKSVRNYGFFLDLDRYSEKSVAPLPLERDPFAQHLRVAFPANPSLKTLTDLHFRGFDTRFPDFWREMEWEREFDAYVADGKLPSLSLVRLMRDHLGEFGASVDGTGTPETQMADNDYALGKLVEKIANSPYRDSTLIFVVEDDAQDGPDHVDAHRSIGFVLGPYVKQGAVVSARYTTVNILRTIEDVLGIGHLSLNDATQRPMTEIFDLAQRDWHFEAKPAAVLRGTGLPVPKEKTAGDPPRPVHDAVWWAERTKGWDFSAEDKVDAGAFNRLLWSGLMPGRDYPE